LDFLSSDQHQHHRIWLHRLDFLSSDQHQHHRIWLHRLDFLRSDQHQHRMIGVNPHAWFWQYVQDHFMIIFSPFVLLIPIYTLHATLVELPVKFAIDPILSPLSNQCVANDAWTNADEMTSFPWALVLPFIQQPYYSTNVACWYWISFFLFP